MSTNVQVPGLGESVSEAVLIKWHKQDGESVKIDEPVCELETDKANVDVPSPSNGVIKRLKNEGDKVHIGEAIATIDPNGQPMNAKPSAPAKESTKPAAAAPPTQPSTMPPAAKRIDDLSPAVRRMVVENKL